MATTLDTVSSPRSHHRTGVLRRGVLLLAIVLAVPSLALASPEVEAVRSKLEKRAADLAEEVLALHCPDRCGLLGVRAEVDAGDPIAAVQPGFEELAPTVREVKARRVEVSVLLDARLPAAFRRDMTGLVQARLKALSVPAVVRTESVSFPVPLPPEPMVDELAPPLPAQPPPMPASEPAPFNPKMAFLERLVEASPWLIGLLLAGLLALLIAGTLRRESGAETPADSAEPTTPPQPRKAPPAIPVSVLLQRVSSQLRDSPRVRVAVMRELLISGDQERFAGLVRLLGAGIADGLREDPQCRPVLRRVGQLLKAEAESELDEEHSRRLLVELEARIAGGRLELGDGAVEEQFAFLDNLSPGQLRRLLDESNPPSQSALLRFAPTHLRDAALDGLDAARRQRLFLTAAESGVADTPELAGIADELRSRAERLGPGDGVAGVELLIELFESQSDAEQAALLDTLASRPALRDALLARTCTESTLASASDDVLAAVAASVDVSLLVDFLRGTEPYLRERILEASPRAMSGALKDELSLSVESGTRFASARREVLRATRSALESRGISLESLNAPAHRRAAG